jgi:histidine triad (HIT) family protein
LIEPYFKNVQLLSVAVEQAVQAQGTFVAMNNRVSQSVPHLHVHIVPRRKGDGLKGFFWPRTKYKNDEEVSQTQAAISATLKELSDRARVQ